MKKFDPLAPPRFWKNPPEKTLYVTGIVHTDIFDDSVIELHGRKYKIEMFGGGDDERRLDITELVKKDNCEYNKQYKEYSKNKRSFEEELVKWKEQKAIWDKEQVVEQERQEKALYRKLKQKFKDKD